MFKALICWWRGHDWPALEGKPGRMVYFNCKRCGEPEAAMIPKH